jgi:hypothetical protein
VCSCAVEPSFTEIFLATFHEKCVYTMPRYLSRKDVSCITCLPPCSFPAVCSFFQPAFWAVQYASMPLYQKALGYEETKEGFEGVRLLISALTISQYFFCTRAEESLYFERMQGIMSLFGAFVQIPFGEPCCNRSRLGSFD